jgi:hypothetical protein
MDKQNNPFTYFPKVKQGIAITGRRGTYQDISKGFKHSKTM